MRLIRKRETAGRIGLRPVSVMRKARNPEGDFPAAIILSRNAVAFLEAEVDAWIERRLAKRDQRRTNRGDPGVQRRDAPCGESSGK